MIILKRKLTVSKSCEEAIQILKSCAYYFPTAIFAKFKFSIYCARRHNGGYLSLTNIRGAIIEDGDRTTIEFEVQADIYFFLGIMITVLGIIGFIYCIACCINRWIPCIGMVLFGILLSLRSRWKGSEILDMIEHKLVR